MNGKSKRGIIFILILLSTMALSVAPGLAAGWEQFHQDATHTGYADGSAPETNNLLWASPSIGAVDASSVVVGEGKVFVNGDQKFIALDAGSGSVIWSVSVAGDFMSYNSWSSPAYDNGKVFLPGDGARRASDGSLIWSGLPWDVNGCPTVADGKVFQGDYDGHTTYPNDWHGHYFAFDEATGKQLWKFDCDDNMLAQGTPAYDNGKVFMTAYDMAWNPLGYLYCVDASTGALAWKKEIEMGLCGSPTVKDGVVYFTTYNFNGLGDVYAVRESDGSVLWSQSIERTDCTPTIAYGNVYVCGGCVGYSDGEKTYCFNAATGAKVWETDYSLNAGVWTNSVAVADGKVFVGKAGTTGGMYFASAGIYCLDAYTGDLIWMGGNGGGSPAVVDGTMYTIDNGRAYAYRDSGASQPSKPTPTSNPVVSQTPTSNPVVSQTPTSNPVVSQTPTADIAPGSDTTPVTSTAPETSTVPETSLSTTSPTTAPPAAMAEDDESAPPWAIFGVILIIALAATAVVIFVFSHGRK